jgi:uncharacterized Fe-S cluster-containing radical SAM superfamily protein
MTDSRSSRNREKGFRRFGPTEHDGSLGEFMFVDADSMASRYRASAVDLRGKRLLVTNYLGTEQEKDLKESANCKGFGRIRHFQRNKGEDWPRNPLPIDPACKTLGLENTEMLRAQVFQLAVCNWRCWYCYVPFNLLDANKKHSALLSPAELVALYLDQPEPPCVVDLSGGQPDLVPEWVPWMIEELQRNGLTEKVYLWSDDNLSNDYFWRYLSEAHRRTIMSYPHYGRVCCFKGFDGESFSFNTLAEPLLFEQQFELMRRLISLGIDLYAYVTFTTPTIANLRQKMRAFVDRLQILNHNFPLRTVPLRIECFTPVLPRLNEGKVAALRNQADALAVWQEELESRFSHAERSRNISEILL